MNDILPAPFAWIDIPGGEITLSHAGGYLADPQTITVAPFAIARHPVTNAQYQAFVDAPDGYHDAQWWQYSPGALDWWADNGEPKQPEFEADHPRTHVTWYEAVAFCLWLSHRTGQSIFLPSEAQWQRAAQGDDGRAYPWGDEWDHTRCKNNTQHDSIGTVPVTDYSGAGDSPYGVANMSGNVWEWTSTSWHSGSNDITRDDTRVLRGGSWFEDIANTYRTTQRGSWNPELTSDLRGFRIATLR